MIYGAARLFPVSGPAIPGGALRVGGGRITGIAPLDDLRTRYPRDRVHLRPDCVILPGLVNVHTHLEYSSFTHLARPSSFRPWIRRLVSESQLRHRFWSRDHWVDAAVRGARTALSCGTTTVGDIVSFGASPSAAHRTGLRMRAYHEAVAWNDESCLRGMDTLAGRLSDPLLDGFLVRPGIAPHSIYTLSPGALKCISSRQAEWKLPSAVHIAESAAEKELLAGRGPLSDHIDRWGLPFRGTPRTFLGYLDEVGLLTHRTLLVHGVHLDDGDMEDAAGTGTTIAACSRSNRMLGCGGPSLEKWAAKGLGFAYGTDSLASVEDLDLFAEARASLPAAADPRETLRRLTLGGAEALHFDDITGSLDEGKAADFIFLEMSDAAGCDEGRIVRKAGSKAVVSTYVGGRRVFSRRTGATSR